jgi:hypothetical protein
MRPSPILSAVIAIPAAVVALALVRPVAAEEELNLGKMADLEALVQRVEEQGFHRYSFAKLRPRLPVDTLVFQVKDNTIEKETAFRAAWATEYTSIAEEVKAAKPDPRLRVPLELRLREASAVAKEKDAKKVFDARQANVKKFLKRYDYGPKVAQAGSVGTAVINVAIAPEFYEVVRRTVYSWKFQPLKDEKGADVKYGKRRIEYTEQLSQSELKEALKMLDNEWFAVRYAKMEKEQETDVIRITGAKLLLGTYYFLEHEDRLVVIREPAK